MADLQRNKKRSFPNQENHSDNNDAKLMGVIVIVCRCSFGNL
ncbi:MAG: hypothetical protein ACHQIM_19010 [Sphingobacteriales bacterium]